MSVTSRLRSLWRNLVARDRVDDELDEELRAIQQMLVDEQIQSGISEERARRQAVLELGGVESIKQQVRETRTGARVDVLLRDVRYGARLLWQNPLFTLTSALSLAIGIGATTTIFTIADALLFKAPQGVFEPRRLVDVIHGDDRGHVWPTSYPNYVDIRDRATTLDGAYAYQLFAEPMSLGARTGAERIFGTAVSANYFAVLGVQAAAGRLFDGTTDEKPGASPVVVLSYECWSRRFNLDPAIVGRVLQINAHPVTIIGVAGEAFRGTSVATTEVWLPLAAMQVLRPDRPALTLRDGGFLLVGARLAPGVSMSEANAEIHLIGQALAREYPAENSAMGLRLVDVSGIPGNVLPASRFLALLMILVSLVLAIACANVTGVLLVRANARRREIAVRMAIGASRARLVGQLLVETLLLFTLGGVAGLVLARWMTSLLVSLLPALPMAVDMSLPLDGRVIAFAVALSLTAALLSGLAPALQASKANVVPALKDSEAGPTGRQWMRHAFIVGQVAFSLLLFIAAGLFARALQHATSVQLGFDPHGVELAQLDLALAGYTEAKRPDFVRQLAERVRQLPGVESASVAAHLPMGDVLAGVPGLTVPGATPPNGEPYFRADMSVVEPDYFATMRIPMLAGRDFRETDRKDTQSVVIVGEAAAQLFWPGREGVGQSLRLEAGAAFGRKEAKTLLVIGVARDVKYRSLREGPAVPFIYLPQQQHQTTRAIIVARTTRGQRITNELRQLVASMDPNLPIVTAQSLEEIVAVRLVPQRVAASVSGSVGIVGLLLAAIGFL